MPKFPMDELRGAYERFMKVSDECAAMGDYNAFADLFTEDCTYGEHAFGEMHGREEVRNWIVPRMKQFPNEHIVRYTHDWTLFDEDNGLFSREEDIYNPVHFVQMLEDWQEAKAVAGS
jgi:hypothetical protein